MSDEHTGHSMCRLEGNGADIFSGMCFGYPCAAGNCDAKPTHGLSWSIPPKNGYPGFGMCVYCREHAEQKQAELGGLFNWDEPPPTLEESMGACGRAVGKRIAKRFNDAFIEALSPQQSSNP